MTVYSHFIEIDEISVILYLYVSKKTKKYNKEKRYTSNFKQKQLSSLSLVWKKITDDCNNYLSNPSLAKMSVEILLRMDSLSYIESNFPYAFPLNFTLFHSICDPSRINVSFHYIIHIFDGFVIWTIGYPNSDFILSRIYIL